MDGHTHTELVPKSALRVHDKHFANVAEEDTCDMSSHHSCNMCWDPLWLHRYLIISLELDALAMLQAHDFNLMAKSTDGTASQTGSQQGDKKMTIEQQLQQGLDKMAAGSSDAEFEKLLSEVCSTLCLLSALEVLG